MTDDRQRPEDEDELDSDDLALLELLAAEEGIDLGADGADRIPLAPRDGALPLSFSQERLWFLDQMEGSAAFHVPLVFRLDGALDTDALTRSLECIAERHEILRTRFVLRDGAPQQQILPAGPVPLRQHDWSGQRRQAELERDLLRELIAQPFDLEQGPLWRVVLARLGEGQHLLAMVMHHIITDGWSTQLLASELQRAYASLSAGQTPELPSLPIQYADFAAWQRAPQQAEALRPQLEFWRETLQGAPPIDLPSDRPRPPIFSGHGAWCHLSLTDDAAPLEALSRQHGATLFMTLLAAFKLLVLRYTGQRDISVGVPTSGRNRDEVEHLLGFFVNTVVMRTAIDGGWSFAQLLAQVRAVCLAAFDHQQVPFERVVETLKPERHLNRNPLFQLMFMLQSAHREQLELAGISATPVVPDWETSQLDLTLAVEREGAGLRLRAEYSTDLFQAETVERMLRHYRAIVRQVLQQPEAELWRLPLLDERERHQALRAFNDTAAELPRRCLHQVVSAVARRVPEAIALQVEQVQLSYGELERRANRLAQLLIRKGVTPGTAVGISMVRSEAMVVTLLGILKAGAAYVPLDPELPADRLHYMITDSGAVLVLADRSASESRLGDCPAPVHLIEQLADELVGCPDEDPQIPLGTDSPAYIIYTSGSTGRPKGVVLPHRSVVNFLSSMAREPGLTADDVLLAVTTISFDISVLELFLPLTVGARVVVASKEESSDGQRLAALIDRVDTTVMQATPATWKLLVAMGWSGRPQLKVLCGGEALSRDLADQLLQRCGELWNMYGPTETTVWSAVAKIEADGAPISIGHPIGNTQLYVLDPQLQPTPVGVAGELYIGGAGLALGYHQRPELTAERFVPDPFAGGEARMYRTGDLVRRMADGAIRYIGRIDFQTKLRGFRIELGEIEANLLALPAVEDAVVLVREDRPGDQRLVAYLVQADGESGSDQQLRRALKQKLPVYMVPATFVRLQRFPLSASGKVDRKALAALQPPAGESPVAAAGHATERTIAEVWSQVLGVEQVGRDANFFDIGGHSLLVPQLVQQLAERLERPVAVVDIFRFPTVRSLALHVDEQPGAARVALSSDHPAAAGQQGDAVAIIGMAGRFPGAASVAELWDNLRAGQESATRFNTQQLLDGGVPRDLFQQPAYVPVAAEIADRHQFDAGFFGFLPREARLLDPQHRAFFQCAWAALEDAGYNPRGVPGAVGVFAGAGMSRHMELLLREQGGGASSMYQLFTSTDKDFIATRTAYLLNLRGPALTVQTACSTSLVAVHLARQALLSGACSVALAGGSAIKSPPSRGYLFQEGMILSPDGHCRPFDASAGGTIPGEGVAAVVLKRLEQAQRDGDHIYAVILGSAINNDGANKVGYTAPSVDGQAEVITEALEAARVTAADIGYVETHGTATALGDVVELGALTQAFGRWTTRRQYCAIGSVKSNIGHLDTAAGVTGLIKAVLALQQEEIPPTLHFQRPNPQLQLEQSPFNVNAQLRPWPRGERPRHAGVSSFGIGGTNAHVVLQEAPPPSARDAEDGLVQLLPLSAATAAALRELAQRYLELLQRPNPPRLTDICFTASAGRAQLNHRLALLGATTGELRLGLERFLAAEGDASGATKVRGDSAQELGLLLDHTDPAWAPPAQELRQAVPALQRRFEQLLQAHGAGAAGPSPTARAGGRVSQLAWALALAETWIDWGLAPSWIAGRGLGLIAAAAASGGLAAERALGLARALDDAARQDAASARELLVDVARTITVGPGTVQLIDAGTGVPPSAEALGADQLEQMMRPLPSDAPPVLPPHDLLLRLDAAGDVDASRADDGGAPPAGAAWQQQLDALRKLYLAGAEIRWSAVYSGRDARRVVLPTYPFARDTYSVAVPGPAAADDAPAGAEVEAHPFLGRHAFASTHHAFAARWTRNEPFWLEHHQVHKTVIVPGMAFVDLLLDASGVAWSLEPRELEDVVFPQPLVLREADAHTVHTVVIRDGENRARLEVLSRPEGDEERAGAPWQQHASASLRELDRQQPPSASAQELRAARDRCQSELDVGGAALGLTLGPTFKNLKRCWQGDGEAIGLLEWPTEVASERERYHIFPGVLDSCLGVAAASAGSEKVVRDADADASAAAPYIPIGVDRVRFYRRPGTRLWCHAKSRSGAGAEGEVLSADMWIYDDDGELALELTGLHRKRARRDSLLKEDTGKLLRMMYEVEWVAQAAAAEPVEAGGQWLVVSDSEQPARALCRALEAAGRGCSCHVGADAIAIAADGAPSLTPALAELLQSAELSRVVCLWGVEPPALGDAPDWATLVRERCGTVLALVQALVQRQAADAPRLLLVTASGQPAAGVVPHPAHGPTLGLARVVREEHPELGCVCIDLESLTDAAALEQLAQTLLTLDDEPEIALRGDERLVRRLRRLKALPQSETPLGGGTALVTGGLGGIGLLVAEWLVSAGVESVALLGRHEPQEPAASRIEQLRQQGARVEVLTGDVADAHQLRRALAQIADPLPPLRAVFHAAGVVDDGALRGQSWSRVADVLAPKVIGTWNLHQLTLEQDLAAFVTFSSISSLVGAMGQASYSAANAFLDSFVYYRRARGLPAVAVNWGAWHRVGMAAGISDEGAARQRQKGLNALTPEHALAALGHLATGPQAQVAVLDMDWSQLARSGASNPLFEALVGAASAAATPAAAGGELTARIRALRPEARQSAFHDALHRLVAQVLGFADPLALDPEQSLLEIGVDSLMSIELRNSIAAALGLTLPVTVVFNYGTVTALAEHLFQQAFSDLPAEESEAPPPAQVQPRVWASAPAGDGEAELVAQMSDEEALEALLAELDEELR